MYYKNIFIITVYTENEPDETIGVDMKMCLGEASIHDEYIVEQNLRHLYTLRVVKLESVL